MGARLLQGFKRLKEKYAIVGEARGLGLMLALELIVPGQGKAPNGEAAMKVLNNCLERGLVAYMAGLHNQVVRFIPPLTVTQEQADEALGILDDSLAAL
jgi:4-aminobutyrate aminotransferase